MRKKKHTGVKVILGIVILLVAAVVLLFGVLTITEFRPEDTEELSIDGTASKVLHAGESFQILTWNVGYCGLGEDADFFMDGGTSVRSADESTVISNMDSIGELIAQEQADIVFLQEVDTSSKRSYYTDELAGFSRDLDGYSNTYALNYKVLYVPYPWPTLGKVTSGIATFSAYEMSESDRISLPCPFKYPVRLANLKRCLMVDRIPIEDSDQELVLVNLHLEAYDDGAGKVAQTAQLRQLLEDEAAKGNYVIAGGDFNQTFSNCDTSGYPLVSEDMWQPGIIDVSEFSYNLQFIMDNTNPTCRSLDQPYADADTDPSVFQYYMIDGFIVSDNIAVNYVSTRNYQFEYSDHNPVFMDVTLQIE
jgi:endonuclease/exonuclease/phosphatase family metal-dependent hydrolase